MCRLRVLSPIVAIALAGCAVGPDFKPPEAPVVAHYTADADPVETVAARGAVQRFVIDERVPAEWWRLFDCPPLNDAVRDALAQSPTIAAAQANLQAARDDLRAGEGVFYPSADGGFTAEREHAPAAGSPLRIAAGTFNLFTLSATANYALDVFGGERRSVEALGATLEYQRNVARATSVTLASNIANTMIAAAAYEAEIAATQRIVAMETRQIRLASVQAQAGTLAYSGVLNLQAQRETTEGLLPPLRQKLLLSQDLLTMLSGRLPASWQPPHVVFSDLVLPHELPLSLPGSLVRQRPDILQAQASLHQASAEIGVATAALLPSVTLDGSFGFSSISTATLLGPAGKAWSFGAGITQPIFRGGTLWFQRRSAIDRYAAASANYRQVVLAAFQQVSDTLRALQHDAEGLAIAERALDTASRALQLAQTNYAAGLATYSDVLLADGLFTQAQIGEIEARASRYQDTVALFVALGGGWWT